MDDEMLLHERQQLIIENVKARFDLGSQLLNDQRVRMLMADPIYTIGFKQTIRRYVADNATQGSRALIAVLSSYLLASLDTYKQSNIAEHLLDAIGTLDDGDDWPLFMPEDEIAIQKAALQRQAERDAEVEQQRIKLLQWVAERLEEPDGSGLGLEEEGD